MQKAFLMFMTCVLEHVFLTFCDIRIKTKNSNVVL